MEEKIPDETPDEETIFKKFNKEPFKQDIDAPSGYQTDRNQYSIKYAKKYKEFQNKEIAKNLSPNDELKQAEIVTLLNKQSSFIPGYIELDIPVNKTPEAHIASIDFMLPESWTALQKKQFITHAKFKATYQVRAKYENGELVKADENSEPVIVYSVLPQNVDQEKGWLTDVCLGVDILNNEERFSLVGLTVQPVESTHQEGATRNVPMFGEIIFDQGAQVYDQDTLIRIYTPDKEILDRTRFVTTNEAVEMRKSGATIFGSNPVNLGSARYPQYNEDGTTAKTGDKYQKFADEDYFYGNTKSPIYKINGKNIERNADDPIKAIASKEAYSRSAGSIPPKLSWGGSIRAALSGKQDDPYFEKRINAAAAILANVYQNDKNKQAVEGVLGNPPMLDKSGSRKNAEIVIRKTLREKYLAKKDDQVDPIKKLMSDLDTKIKKDNPSNFFEPLREYNKQNNFDFDRYQKTEKISERLELLTGKGEHAKPVSKELLADFKILEQEREVNKISNKRLNKLRYLMSENWNQAKGTLAGIGRQFIVDSSTKKYEPKDGYGQSYPGAERPQPNKVRLTLKEKVREAVKANDSPISGYIKLEFNKLTDTEKVYVNKIRLKGRMEVPEGWKADPSLKHDKDVYVPAKYNASTGKLEPTNWSKGDEAIVEATSNSKGNINIRYGYESKKPIEIAGFFSDKDGVVSYKAASGVGNKVSVTKCLLDEELSKNITTALPPSIQPELVPAAGIPEVQKAKERPPLPAGPPPPKAVAETAVLTAVVSPPPSPRPPEGAVPLAVLAATAAKKQAAAQEEKVSSSPPPTSRPPLPPRPSGQSGPTRVPVPVPPKDPNIVQMG